MDGLAVDARGSPVVSFCPSTHGEQGRACTQSSATNMYTRSNNNYDFAAPLKNDNHIPRANLLFKFQNFYFPCSILTIKLAKSESMFCLMIFELFDRQSPNVSTTPLWQWGFQQCLTFSWTALRGKHCQHSITVMGVVDTLGHQFSKYNHFLLVF